ncbi:hypothetical protein TNCV_3582911 [Trichonephila clavipes]|nr:hypothetical protein TNCV_3582911 [Trichonephila clavipes]
MYGRSDAVWRKHGKQKEREMELSVGSVVSRGCIATFQRNASQRNECIMRSFLIGECRIAEFFSYVLTYAYATFLDEDLVARISEAAARVREIPSIFEWVHQSLQRCSQAYITTGGRSFEQSVILVFGYHFDMAQKRILTQDEIDRYMNNSDELNELSEDGLECSDDDVEFYLIVCHLMKIWIATV